MHFHKFVRRLLTLIATFNAQVGAGGAETLVSGGQITVAGVHTETSDQNTVTIIGVNTHTLNHYKLGMYCEYWMGLRLRQAFTLTILGCAIVVHFVCLDIRTNKLQHQC